MDPSRQKNLAAHKFLVVIMYLTHIGASCLFILFRHFFFLLREICLDMVGSYSGFDLCILIFFNTDISQPGDMLGSPCIAFVMTSDFGKSLIPF